MFIYLITNLVNGKKYVGKHKGPDVYAYLDKCFARALKGSEEKPLLYRALRKYGVDSFAITILECGDETEEQLNALERFWIVQLDCRNVARGYNIAAGGEGGYGKGLPEHYRAEHAARMTGTGNPSFGKAFPAPAGSGTRAAQKWMTEHSEEHKANCVKAVKSSWEGLTLEQREARLAPMKAARWKEGATSWRDPESKRLMSARNTGSGNPFFNKKHSEETKALIGEKARARAETRRHSLVSL